jgi:hypothetical protein
MGCGSRAGANRELTKADGLTAAVKGVPGLARAICLFETYQWWKLEFQADSWM